ncbi:MAG: EamA family transporter RarD [Rhizobiaceae bacterium]|nr:EamA family transporter RarD [Rhizobiaceae bacterium]
MAASESAARSAIGNEDTPAGLGLAITVYLLWGGLPLYLKMVSHIPPLEVVAHRVIWSLPIAAVALMVRGRLGDVWQLIRQPRKIGMAMATAALITANWLVYVYAIGSGHTVEAALGYYINPLISVIIAALVLKEELKPAQMVAIGLAMVAVAILAWDAGGLPWISLTLATTWGFYALFRKTLPLGPNQGFFLEVLILTAPTLAYIVYLETSGAGHFIARAGAGDAWLLAFAGVATAVPLIIYANAAKLLRLSTIGIMQYIAPSFVFLIAVFVFREPFGSTKLIAFCFIWAALVVYSVSMFRGRRR